MVKQLTALDMNNSKITNLATPTIGTDAANKSYVDANAGGSNVSLSPIQTVQPSQYIGNDSVPQQTYAHAVVVGQTTKIDRITSYCYAYSGTPSTLEMGIYDSSGSLLASGTTSVTSIGPMTVSITEQTLTSGLYYLAIVNQTNDSTTTFSWGNNAGTTATLSRIVGGTTSLAPTLAAGSATGRTYAMTGWSSVASNAINNGGTPVMNIRQETINDATLLLSDDIVFMVGSCLSVSMPSVSAANAGKVMVVVATTPNSSVVTVGGTYSLPLTSDSITFGVDSLGQWTVVSLHYDSVNAIANALTNYATLPSEGSYLVSIGAAKITVGTTEPDGPAPGDLWVDTN